MDFVPPRIVILDNDQTTGDYDIFFKWLYWLESTHVKNYLDIIPILTAFTKIFEEVHIFRPGLRPFLKRLAELKREKKIDYIVIYTNQSESAKSSLKDIRGTPITIPFLLQIMYNCLAEESIIDLRLTRPDGPIPIKSFSRVFNALNIPTNCNAAAEKTLFFDDLIEHCPETDDVDAAEKGHVRVADYRVPFDPYLFLRLCRITISIALKNNTSARYYKKGWAARDLHLARSITELLETELFEEMCAPYRKCVLQFGDPRSHGFSKYIEHVERTFNDVEQIEV